MTPTLERAHSPRAGRRASRRTILVLWILIALGSAVRIAYFRADTSLWGDEAAIALNLQQRSYRELTHPLDSNQHAPYLFLLTEKVLLSTFGLNEHWLRAPALFSSLTALSLFPWVARRFISTRAVIIGTALFAFCPGLVRYAAELKPYPGDALASLIVCGFGIAVLDSRFNRVWLGLFALAGAVLVWASYPCVFVLFGVGTALLLDRFLARNRADAVACMAVVIVWLASFTAVYVVMMRYSLANHELESFWDYAFAPLPPRSVWDLRHSVEILMSPFVNPLGLAGVGLGGSLFVLGIWRMSIVNWRLMAFCLLPVVTVFLASGVHAYPFATRLILFLLPFLIMPLAEGAASLTVPHVPRHWTHLMLAGFLVVPPAIQVNDLLDSPERSGVRDVLSAIGGRATTGDGLYLYYMATTSFRLYRQQLGPADLHVVLGHPEVRQSQRVLDDLRQLSGHRRVWFLFSEVQTFFGDEEKLMLADIEKQGRRHDTVVVGPTRAYLYESPTGQWTSN